MSKTTKDERAKAPTNIDSHKFERAAAFTEQVQNARLSDEEIAKLPKDPEANYEGAVDNDKRASFALQALVAYNIATGSDLETAIKDFIGDLGHFLDRHNIGDSCDPQARPTMADLIADAARMYSEETQGNGQQFNATANSHEALLEACKCAQELIGVARQYFPKSVRNSDTFTLENTNAAIGKAIAKANGGER